MIEEEGRGEVNGGGGRKRGGSGMKEAIGWKRTREGLDERMT